jgi:opacity protein-like surface antigen
VKRLFIATVALVLCYSSFAMAEADIGFKGIGGKIGFVSPDNIDGTFGLGAFVNLGTFAPQVGFEATLDYWGSSSGSGSFSVDFRDIIFGARAKYLFKVNNEKWKPYAGGGLALHLFNSDTPAIDFGPPIGVVGGGSDSSTKIGVDLIGGSGYTVGEKVDLVGELMYRIVSDVGQFVIYAGAVYWFGG